MPAGWALPQARMLGLSEVPLPNGGDQRVFGRKMEIFYTLRLPGLAPRSRARCLILVPDFGPPYRGVYAKMAGAALCAPLDSRTHIRWRSRDGIVCTGVVATPWSQMRT